LKTNHAVSSERRRGRWIVRGLAVGAIALFLALLMLAAAAAVPFSSETVRRSLIATLSDRLDSDVELDSLRLRALPRFHVEASGLRIWLKGRHSAQPLIKVDSLTVDASVPNLYRKHVNSVTLTGLDVSISHRDDQDEMPERREGSVKGLGGKDLVIDELLATDARLLVIPESTDKLPKIWDIHRLRMQTVSFDRAMPFQATLTNAVPPGEIQTQGSFGPWQPRAPDRTAVEGTFTLAGADLSVFHGIAGLVSAHGEFGGVLGRLGIHGEVEAPHFTLAISGHPIPLHVDYHMTVDSMHGDTFLDRVDGSFLKTRLTAKGNIVGKPGRDGRTVALDVDMSRARVEDVLRLVMKTPAPLMTGAMTLKSKFLLPPGDPDVMDRLRLDGQFEIGTARFTSIDVQKKIDELSRRTRRPDAAGTASNVVSQFGGRFKFGNGALTLSPLTFSTPGTHVEMAGAYELRPETVDFKGTLMLDGKLSDTQTGWKRLALKSVDPIFARKGGEGSSLPIKVHGAVADPDVGLDVGALFRRD
jgi:hypothetical protein